jgi:hypothetical protein
MDACDVYVENSGSRSAICEDITEISQKMILFITEIVWSREYK